MPGPPPAIVIGAGLSGAACALELARAGLPVRVLDRGRRPGGRLGLLTLRDTGTRCDGRVVDVGASYMTARDPAFAEVVDDLVARGVLRPWTDTFHIAEPDGIVGTRTGPIRYAAPTGLRSVVDDLLDQARTAAMAGEFAIESDRTVAQVETGLPGVPGGPGVPGAVTVDGSAAAAVALCMPGPQAHRLLVSSASLAPLAGTAESVRWEPVLVLTAVYPDRCWLELDGVFVNDDPVLTWIADDGRRRGDGAPVLVAHADPVLSAAHLDDPQAAAPVMLAALRRVLKCPIDPDWFTVRRWGLAKPMAGREEPFALRGQVGLGGDWWHCADGQRPRTESAYLSGRALGQALVAGIG